MRNVLCLGILGGFGLIAGCDSKPTTITTPPAAPAGHAKYGSQTEKVPKPTGGEAAAPATK